MIWLWAASLCLAHSHIRLVKADSECDSVDKRGSVKNGADCSEGSDCASGACYASAFGSDTCECCVASDCPDGEICNIPYVGANTCDAAPSPPPAPPPPLPPACVGADCTFCSIIGQSLPDGSVVMCTCQESTKGLGFKLSCKTENIAIVGVLGASLDIAPCDSPASLALQFQAIGKNIDALSFTAGKPQKIGIPGLSFDHGPVTFGAQADVDLTGNADQLSVDISLGFCAAVGQDQTSACLSSISSDFPIHIIKETWKLGNACVVAKKKAKGMSGGKIAGIVIGVLAGVGLLAGGGFFLYSKSKQRPSNAGYQYVAAADAPAVQ